MRIQIAREVCLGRMRMEALKSGALSVSVVPRGPDGREKICVGM